MGVAVLAVLGGCTSADHVTKGSTPDRVLHGLRSCLDLIDAGFALQASTPCLHTQLGTLAGISRAALIQELGPAQWCYGLPLSSPGKDGDCTAVHNPAWDFVAHGRPFTGSGMDLVCVADGSVRCKRLIWSSSPH
jgi:hypothetical protein